jgi:hypothetical protein
VGVRSQTLIKQAEAYLKAAALQPGYAIVVLKVHQMFAADRLFEQGHLGHVGKARLAASAKSTL